MKPVANIFAGVNGAGKTTLYFNALEKMINLGYRINIDEITQSIGDWRDKSTQIRAARIAIKMRKMYIQNHDSFNLETTLCGNSILNLFKELKEKEYRIVLYYIALDSVETAKERVLIRVNRGGHGIDPFIIQKRFYESQRNLLKIMPFCDEISFYDNSTYFVKAAEIKNHTVQIFENITWMTKIVKNNDELKS